MKLKTFLCGAAASLGVFLGAAQSQQPQQAGKDLVWAYPVPDPPPTATDDKAPKKLPGSAKSYTQAQIDDRQIVPRARHRREPLGEGPRLGHGVAGLAERAGQGRAQEALVVDEEDLSLHAAPSGSHSVKVTPRAGEFTPLPGRLTRVTSGMPEDAVTYIDDGLATSVTPAIAAITLFVDQPLVLLCGGFDRGVDYAPLADALASRTAPTHVLTLGPAGERIGESLGGRVTREAVATMDEAVARAREVLSGSGVMLFSPAAPSFDRYTNWEERSKDFTRAVSATGQTDDETDEQSGNQSPA